MIGFVSLRESILLGNIENAAAHLRRASFHFMCGKPEWASVCIAKANKDFEKARRDDAQYGEFLGWLR